MSQKITLAALLLTCVPLAGLADDGSSDKKNDDRSRESVRDSSDIMRSEDARLVKYEQHIKKREKSTHQGGQNPSPDD